MDNQLQQKLSAFETPPPGAVWERLTLALDEGQAAYAARLREYQEVPDSVVWHRIENDLNESLPAKVIPFRTRFKTPIRYASAAAIIGVVLIINTLVTKRTEAGALDNAQQGAAGLTKTPASTNHPNKKEETNTASSTIEWVTYHDAQGDSMRLPRQLFDRLHCKNGDNGCRMRIAELRKKLSSATTTSDFTGLLEMLQQIK